MQKINTKLLKNFIDSDFLIVNRSKENSKYSDQLKINKQNLFSILDILNLNKELKQFVRVLQFVKKKGNINILLENKFSFFLFNKLILKYNLNNFINNINLVSKIKVLKECNELLILLGNSFNNVTTKTIKRLFTSNIFLLQQINLNKEFNFNGTYKIFNDLEDIKKFLFFVILLKSMLINK